MINHKVPTYKEEAIFWTSGNSEDLLNDIENTEFWNGLQPSEDEVAVVRARQAQSQFPVKKSNDRDGYYLERFAPDRFRSLLFTQSQIHLR